MISLELIQKIWSLIIPPSSAFSKVEARELNSIQTQYGYPLVTIDIKGNRHLLIPTKQSSEVREDTQSAGIHITADEWGEQKTKHLFIDVVCVKPHLNHIFDLIIFDILSELGRQSDQPGQVCRRVLNKWREFVEKEPSSVPDKTALTGVFGEIWLLHKLSLHNIDAVQTWVGPTGARYDFYTGKTAIEVKTSTQRKGCIVIIHGPDQLESPPDGKLYLAVIQVEEMPSNGEAVPELIAQMLDLGCSRTKLYTALSSIGITPDIIEECGNLRFNVVAWNIYHVDDNFPALRTSSFKEERVPNGVVDIIYKIDLSAEPPQPLKKEDAEHLLRRFAEET